MIITNSARQTIALGKKYAAELKLGAVLGLIGELGAGKTQFVKGLAKGLGIKNNISSPTFVLLKKYNQLIHIDCYRLSNSEELLDLGWQELVTDKNNIIVVEWADKIRKIMPQDTRWIKFSIGKKDNQRKISI
ncbi:tRNA (adenosine(37)-N6)-threonylcarbamoyltransferase complex ATPase subunit type 1 TsaE [Candidatus Kuenenbacteria bacterium CG_4_9_14_3_um_filter_39_14]|uniref:tRNA threonylcarbamoyladenosine biosynthesis protein TsaE n=6 Tax=Candidatus Kueneniibacteriota TaxID=1752740 RepID=A0A2M7IMB6_9BACT|nr:tRNA (adenosine(37)-N6)-threonylcarbamoyltransferase complex ATPase subunit type 1 TsaE [Candidatus Kuenenbacteria bacterium]OIP56476.1 MAG: tRNA (adenosine(37)-N6)-threonylcarbamoyltransferase complex ATPase subunit type 1 TsaE [Candidatus Kuenenbacteria bacterium CG2_30_39_24]PIP75647.1 MAG: tRNA (adenosine(37)-N6)-threonylcarbamoyltransferase complex ATPase subunit type 1 TsaE [Candidatus Kuenenbacteria bacterium CG22_combo_CG10-13_8_21_14_all_39_9]PIR80952.1 MAG: tRNA (adenosine(37)-N6)-t